MKGKFITFEGGEGSGKTSVIKALREVYPEQFVFFNDPSSTIPECIKIRELLLSKSYNLSKNAELLLYGAARAQLAEQIKTNLDNGLNVICDRYFDSTAVYQGKLKGHPSFHLQILNSMFCGDLIPDMTILFDVNAKTGLARSNSRLSGENIDESRWEEMGLEVHKKINFYYREIASMNYDRFRIINSNGLTISEMIEEATFFIDDLLLSKDAIQNTKVGYESVKTQLS